MRKHLPGFIVGLVLGLALGVLAEKKGCPPVPAPGVATHDGKATSPPVAPVAPGPAKAPASETR